MHAKVDPVREDFLTSDGVRLSWLRAGSRTDQPTLLLVPGWCMPATVWSAQLEALAGDRAVIALDPRGQGESERPAHGLEIDRRALDLHEVATAHAPVIVVGWSLGALEALHAIHRCGTGPLAGVVLVDSSVGEAPAPPPGTPFQDRLRSDRVSALQDFVRAIFRQPRPEAELQALVDAALRLPLEQSLALFPGALPREHWRDIARALRLPLLYAVTEQYLEQAGNLRQHRPGTWVEVFPNAGHALFADQPDRFNRLLVRFARDLAPPRTQRGG